MSSSDSSSLASSNGSSGPLCRFRTFRYHDQECSRFFDCPSHILARAREAEEQEDEEAEEQNEQEGYEDADDQEIEDDSNANEDDANESQHDVSMRDVTNEDQDLIDPFGQAFGALRHAAPDSDSSPSSQPISQLSEQTTHRQKVSAGKQKQEVIDLTDSPPQRAQDAPVAAGPSNTALADSQHNTDVIDLTGESSPLQDSRPERALPALPPLGSSSSSLVTHSSRGGAISPSAQRRPATPPSPPPPTRRRTATNQLSGAPATTSMESPQQLQQPQRRPSAARRPSDITLPRWQPDAEVTFCPICRTQFSFLVRKHHCRKCGRVVCSSCSPHRITIPYQYIVVPPGMPRPGYARYPSSLISGEGGYADFSSLGGGERVRLCNPCVPDPNTNPPQGQQSPTSIRSHGRSHSTVGSGSGYGFNMAGVVSDAYSRSRSATMLPNTSHQSSGNMPYQPTQNRILSGTPPSHYSFGGSSSSSAYRVHRLRSPLDATQGTAAAASSSSAAAQRRPLPPDPPPIAEEDECPVCHRELPPRELPNFETLREAHIGVCITSHSTYGGMSAVEGTSSRPRRTGMFPYLATEKDCVDSAECTICLEEFEAGVPMARLECLCRFHRDCIARWFAKNPGRCPVHSHDGHGF
ncbi:FYVE zinc finger-domain-containing protein [Coniella lustricola]|uniref:RING-type E3 ubiquitin transferase n=1 Tax=Coniella lustricola TaxID=2025994 RepID=A0A2T3AIV9_9PEZI|nr:FYVE zinc finger-domain-containing protein [Coniella lustricola]